MSEITLGFPAARYVAVLMSLYLFLIVVVSLACGSIDSPADFSVPSVSASLGIVMAWALLARGIAAAMLASIRRGVPVDAAIRSLERRLDLLRWLGLPAVMLCLVGFGLAPASRGWPIIADSLFLQAIILLAPAAGIIASTLWAEHQFGAAMGYTAGGLRETIRCTAGGLVRYAGWMAAPILTVLLLSDLIGLLPAGDHVAASAAPGVLAILLIPLLVPVIAKRVWSTRRLRGEEDGWIRELVTAAGLPSLEVRVWQTGMRTANAVVVGFLPGMRSLLITDRLLRDLTPDQLRLIILHEIAHIRRGHIWWRMLAVVPAWLIAGGLLHVYGTDTATMLLSNAVAILGTLLMLGAAAHATEFDADRWACETSLVLPEHPPAADDPESDARDPIYHPPHPRVPRPKRRVELAVREAESFAAALRRVVPEAADARRFTWLHPGVDARCRRLRLWAMNQQRATPSIDRISKTRREADANSISDGAASLQPLCGTDA